MSSDAAATIDDAGASRARPQGDDVSPSRPGGGSASGVTRDDAHGDAASPSRRVDGGRAATSASPHAARRRLSFERPVDLGPATPTAAISRGVVLRRSASDVVGVRVAGSAAEVSARVTAARRTDDPPVALRFGPPVLTAGGHSYWIARGKLLRRAFDWATLTTHGEVETLASDALDGTRVSAGSADTVELVAYVARAGGSHEERHARLWSSGAGAVDLSESGAGASSIALAGQGGRWVAVWLDARAAMSPVHGRAIEIIDATPRLGGDVVVFVGPSPEGIAEVNALAWPGGLAAFIPFARDTSAFGLAVVEVGMAPRLDAKVAWAPYPNGIDPAPVGSALVCGAPWVAYVRPRSSAPDAPAVLQLGQVVDEGIDEEASAAEGFDFMAVSLAARDGGGAWLSWVANGRSWVRGVACL